MVLVLGVGVVLRLVLALGWCCGGLGVRCGVAVGLGVGVRCWRRCCDNEQHAFCL